MWQDRTVKLIGSVSQQKINNLNIIVFGVGGVGSYVVEGLARAGVGSITVVDSDVVDVTNINRQLIALNSTIGKNKVDVIKDRILDINPKVNVKALKTFVSKDNLPDFNLQTYDYVVDAIDNVTAKIELAVLAQKQNFNLISCMGTGNKLNPQLFEIADIYNTSVCPLAKVMRKELKARGIKKLTVLYSKEQPIKTSDRTPASISFVPSIAGLLIAGHIINSFLRA